MKCWDRFDMRFVLTMPAAVERRGKFLSEAARVGLDVECYYNPKVPLELRGLGVIPTTRFVHNRPGHGLCGVGHYRIVKTALESGASTVLVAEDDAVFLKNTGLLEKIVETLPADFDIAMFDSLNSQRYPPDQMRKDMERERQNDCWTLMPDDPRSTGLYALSRRGMEYLVGCCDEAFDFYHNWGTVDWYLARASSCRGRFRCYCASPRAAIQQVWPGSLSEHDRSHGLAIAQRYEALGVDLSAYNLGGNP